MGEVDADEPHAKENDGEHEHQWQFVEVEKFEEVDKSARFAITAVDILPVDRIGFDAGIDVDMRIGMKIHAEKIGVETRKNDEQPI